MTFWKTVWATVVGNIIGSFIFISLYGLLAFGAILAIK